MSKIENNPRIIQLNRAIVKYEHNVQVSKMSIKVQKRYIKELKKLRRKELRKSA